MCVRGAGFALALNPRDYRAWYGLGQTYEVLQLQNFSLYYYAKAQSLRYVLSLLS